MQVPRSRRSRDARDARRVHEALVCSCGQYDAVARRTNQTRNEDRARFGGAVLVLLWPESSSAPVRVGALPQQQHGRRPRCLSIVASLSRPAARRIAVRGAAPWRRYPIDSGAGGGEHYQPAAQLGAGSGQHEHYRPRSQSFRTRMTESWDCQYLQYHARMLSRQAVGCAG